MTPGEPLGAGQIYDSNRSTLLASLCEQGFPATDVGIARDDRESLVQLIKQGLAAHDVLITSGGVSMGEKVKLCAWNKPYQQPFVLGPTTVTVLQSVSV